MSLYALPVSVADLEQLQLGIQFYTNVAEATSEAALINAQTPGQTVFSYAQQLLAANISTSQVAMADNTLMYDQLASVSTLSTQCVGPPAPGFLPSQVTYAIAHGFDPTVFAAQALGLALSNPLGGTNNFQTNYGGLSNTAFASAAAIAIFGSATPGLVNFALSHVAYWTNFYTVNGINGDTTPTAQQIQIAAYGATFGEMVGVALENPSVAPVLVADVANALIVNAEGLYPAGGNTAGGFETLPPHIPLQGESAAIGQTIVLTPGQDTAISGQTYIPGIAGGPTPPIVASSDVTISGLLGGVFGNQPTLTAGDNIQLNGNFNALIATFNTNGTYTVAGETIKGVQTWTFSNFGTGVVNILGGVNVGGPGPLGGTNNPGVQTLTYSDSGAGSTLNVGTAGAGIQSVLTTINSTFNGNNSTVSVYIAEAAFLAFGSSSIVVTVDNPAGAVFTTVDAGPDSGSTGYTGFAVVSDGGSGTVNEIRLGATEATNASGVLLGGDAATTVLFASASNSSGEFNWANLTRLDGTTGSGNQEITGLEVTNGFLSDLTGSAGVFSISLSNANDNTADLTAWTATAANLKIALGTGTGNELDLNNGLVTTTTAFGAFSGVAIVGDAGTNLGGTVNWLAFPGASELLLLDAGGGMNAAQTHDFNIINAPATFLVNFQNDNMNGHNFNIATANGGTLTVDFNNVSNSTGTFAASNYNVVDLNVTSSISLYGAHFTVESPVGAAAPTLNVDLNSSFLDLANGTPVTPATVGHDTLSLFGGTVVAPTDGSITLSGHGTFEIGVTNALSITDHGANEVTMTGPADSPFVVGVTGVSGVSVVAGGTGSELQGSLGTLAKDAEGLNWTGLTGTDSLTDTAGSTNFYGDGGGDSISQGGGANEDFFGTLVTGLTQHGQSITDVVAGAEVGQIGFWGFTNTTGPGAITASTSADMTTITGFAVTGTHDELDFNVDAWAGGGTGVGKLVDAGGGSIATPGFANAGLLVGAGGTVGAGVDLVLYNVAGLTGATTLAAALAGVGAIDMAGAISHNEHVLVAYQVGTDVRIADVDFLNGTGAGNTTSARSIVASDVVDLGSVSLAVLGVNAHTDVHFSGTLG